jgi:hypothetical protein
MRSAFYRWLIGLVLAAIALFSALLSLIDRPLPFTGAIALPEQSQRV